MLPPDKVYFQLQVLINPLWIWYE